MSSAEGSISLDTEKKTELDDLWVAVRWGGSASFPSSALSRGESWGWGVGAPVIPENVPILTVASAPDGPMEGRSPGSPSLSLVTTLGLRALVLGKMSPAHPWISPTLVPSSGSSSPHKDTSPIVKAPSSRPHPNLKISKGPTSKHHHTGD